MHLELALTDVGLADVIAVDRVHMGLEGQLCRLQGRKQRDIKGAGSTWLLRTQNTL